MKRLPMLVLLVLTLAALTLNCATHQPGPSAEEEIWKLEETYSKNRMDANHAAILAAYHEDFLGWPHTSPGPEHKADMPEYLKRNVAKPSNDAVEI